MVKQIEQVVTDMMPVEQDKAIFAKSIKPVDIGKRISFTSRDTEATVEDVLIGLTAHQDTESSDPLIYVKMQNVTPRYDGAFRDNSMFADCFRLYAHQTVQVF